MCGTSNEKVIGVVFDEELPQVDDVINVNPP